MTDFAAAWDRTPAVTKGLAVATVLLYTYARGLERGTAHPLVRERPTDTEPEPSGSVLLFGLGATMLSVWLLGPAKG
jgi:hypothetical protein